MLGLGTDITSSSYVSMDLKDATTDLELWLKNGVGITSDESNRVSKWEDSSGNDNHATQGSTGDMALLSGGGLDFELSDGDHYDLESAITIAENGGFCFAAVLNIESHSGDNTLLSKDSNDQIRITSDSAFRFRANNPSDTSTTFVFESNTFPTATKLLVLLNRSAGASNRFTLFKNGIQLTPNVDSSTAEAEGENPNGFDINVIGAKAGTANFFDGKILELAFWSKGLSAQEITDVNDYLKSVHGL